MKNITISTTLAASSLFLTATSLLPSQASNTSLILAQQPNCKSPQTTLDQSLCSSQEFQAADRKLNQVYQQLQPKLNSKQSQRLIVAQRSWLKFRDESCDYEAGYFEGGSVAPSIYGYCRARVTKERIKDLERYLEQASL
ncbi:MULTISPECIES: lysozyme inhibitor LprI family protein [unclassified Microcoleus]|uniref:lysozyme inhibitor LprI family protein n=1 Tax=unclassified Microcoleus TaxID=2642155 RepID=UPI0025ECC3B8|nr:MULTISPECIES: lysozyme inhibitor LprI family protein [unclassified Microcoleus]